MADQTVFRDERTVAVENAGYRWAYLTLSFGLLLCTMYRSFVLRESAWDLLALVVVGGVVATGYQATRRVLTRRWLVVVGATLVVAAAVAFALVVL